MLSHGFMRPWPPPETFSLSSNSSSSVVTSKSGTAGWSLIDSSCLGSSLVGIVLLGVNSQSLGGTLFIEHNAESLLSQRKSRGPCSRRFPDYEVDV